MYNVSIPEITDDELLARYEKIKPILEYNGKKYHLRNFNKEELKKLSYIFTPEINMAEPVDMSLYVARPDLEFECLHSFGYYGIFKPSIAEVLAQIPESELDSVDAFEIIRSPSNWSDFMKNKIIFENGYHVSTVRLYTSRNNPNVIFDWLRSVVRYEENDEYITFFFNDYEAARTSTYTLGYIHPEYQKRPVIKIES